MTLDGLPALERAPTVTAAQMAQADRAASEVLGVPLEALMENAARQIAVVTRLLAGDVAGMRIGAVCGSGNNGGDALAALRHLHGWGARVEAFVTAPREHLRPLAALQYRILERLGVPIHPTATLPDAALASGLGRQAVLLDGLLGYSAIGAPRGEVARLITAVTASERVGHVVAVDLPSGLDPDTGESASGAPATVIAASITVTLAVPKAGLPREHARRYVGELVLADIGIPAEAFTGMGIDARGLFAKGDLVRIIR